MQITDVRVNKVNTDNKIKAFASVTFDDMLVVRDFRVTQGEEGLFVSFPSKKRNGGDKYYDVVFPLSKEFRQTVCEKVLAEYNAN